MQPNSFTPSFLAELATKVSCDGAVLPEASWCTHGFFELERVSMFAGPKSVELHFAELEYGASGKFLGAYGLFIDVATAKEAAALLCVLMRGVVATDGPSARAALVAIGFKRMF